MAGNYKIGKKEYMRLWRLNNKDKVRDNFNKWCEENPERRKEQELRSYEKIYSTDEGRAAAVARASEWKKRNPSIVNFYTAKRRSGKAKRTPAWADPEAIKFFYECCPKGFHVDHIIPLHGKLISGLHVENNLQWLPADKNLLKSNKFTGY